MAQEAEARKGIPLSMYRSEAVHKKYDRKRYENLFAQYSGNAGSHRIYIPLIDVDAVVEAPAAIKEFLSHKGYDVKDYRAGLACKKEDAKRIVRIGKMIQNELQLKSQYDNDTQRQASDSNLMVCISRHPYDILGMSYNRGWSSCMNLDDGENKDFLETDVEEGTLVAYLIEANDRNIRNPLARTRICNHEYSGTIDGSRRAYRDDEDEEDEDTSASSRTEAGDDMDATDFSVLVPAYRTYGAVSYEFDRTVQKFAEDFNRSMPEGEYTRRAGVYEDYGDVDEMYLLKSAESALKWINRLGSSSVARYDRLLPYEEKVKFWNELSRREMFEKVFGGRPGKTVCASIVQCASMIHDMDILSRLYKRKIRFGYRLPLGLILHDAGRVSEKSLMYMAVQYKDDDDDGFLHVVDFVRRINHHISDATLDKIIEPTYNQYSDRDAFESNERTFALILAFVRRMNGPAKRTYAQRLMGATKAGEFNRPQYTYKLRNFCALVDELGVDRNSTDYREFVVALHWHREDAGTFFAHDEQWWLKCIKDVCTRTWLTAVMNSDVVRAFFLANMAKMASLVTSMSNLRSCEQFRNEQRAESFLSDMAACQSKSAVALKFLSMFILNNGVNVDEDVGVRCLNIAVAVSSKVAKRTRMTFIRDLLYFHIKGVEDHRVEKRAKMVAAFSNLIKNNEAELLRLLINK